MREAFFVLRLCLIVAGWGASRSCCGLPGSGGSDGNGDEGGQNLAWGLGEGEDDSEDDDNDGEWMAGAPAALSCSPLVLRMCETV